MAQPPIRVQPGQRLSEEEWKRHSAEISAGLQDLLDGPEGEALRSLLTEQVELITSLPIDAGLRVQALAVKAASGAGNYQDIIAEILRTSEVTLHRANLIARTETARANAALTQVRAEQVGSVGYIWQTAGDSAVRDEHRKLNGKFFTWDSPPVAAKDGTRAHPGGTYNCRCWASPVMPGEEPRGRRRLEAS